MTTFTCDGTQVKIKTGIEDPWAPRHRQFTYREVTVVMNGHAYTLYAGQCSEFQIDGTAVAMSNAAREEFERLTGHNLQWWLDQATSVNQ